MQELERQFKADGGTFKEYKIGDLFESSNGDFDIQKSHINGIGDYVITAGLTNNGILGKTDVKAKVFEPYTLTVDMFGSSFYRCFKYKMVTHARVFSMKPKLEINDEQGLYLSCSLKYLEKLFGYENMCSWEKIKALPIHLPILANGEISFSYMECVIRELQDERISTLTDYLKESGFGNTELTQEEKDAVLQLRSGEVKWKEFKVCGKFGIFNVNNTHSILQSQIVPKSGEYPYVTASENNNSVSTYVNYDMEQIEEGNSIMIGGKTLVITYQESDYFSNDSHNLACYVKDEKGKSKEIQLFLVSALYKNLKPKYSWGDSISKKKIQKDIFFLPVTSDGTIDWAFMQNLISAESRLAIRGVVEWKDKVINNTKK